MFFPWPRRAKKYSRSADRKRQLPLRSRRRLGIDPLEQRQLLAVSIAPAFVTVAEGNSGTTNQVFTVSLDSPEASPVTVRFQTNDGAAPAAPRCWGTTISPPAAR